MLGIAHSGAFRGADADVHDDERKHDHQRGARIAGEHEAYARKRARNHDVPCTFVGTIRVLRPEHHRDHREHARHTGKQPGFERAETILADDQRRPQAERIKSRRGAEVDQREREHARIAQRVECAGRVACMRVPRVGFELQLRDQPVALLGLQPLGLRGLVGQILEHAEAEDDRRQALRLCRASASRRVRRSAAVS
ncbi:hypothetical protein QFZ96_006442 [Paraburkholderia youngii]